MGDSILGTGASLGSANPGSSSSPPLSRPSSPGSTELDRVAGGEEDRRLVAYECTAPNNAAPKNAV